MMEAYMIPSVLESTVDRMCVMVVSWGYILTGNAKSASSYVTTHSDTHKNEIVRISEWSLLLRDPLLQTPSDTHKNEIVHISE